MGRATIEISRGNLRTAFRANPLVLVLVPLLVWGISDFARWFLSQDRG